MRQVDLKLSFNTTLQRFSSQPFFFFLPSKKKLHLLNNEWVNSRRRVFFFARRDWRIEALLCRSLFNSCELKMSFQRAPVRLIFGWKTICAAAFYIDETLTPIELMYILVVNVVFSFYTYTFNPYMNFSFIAANQHYCNAHTHPAHVFEQSVGRPVSQSTLRSMVFHVVESRVGHFWQVSSHPTWNSVSIRQWWALVSTSRCPPAPAYARIGFV